MPCISHEELLSKTARSLLEALDHPMTEGDIAQKTGLPLYRVRSEMRKMTDAGLAAKRGEGIVGRRRSPAQSLI